MIKGKKAVILLSGGIDSSTALAVAKDEGYELYALTFDYNQRHKRELESAGLVASNIGVKEHLIIRFDLRGIGGSALTSDIEVPKTIRSEIRNPKSEIIPITYVPARNTIFLSFAIARAEVLNSGNIFVGANAIDYSGYPDCRPEYLRAFEEMANLATKASIEGGLRFIIRAPLISMKKSEIIRKGIELGFDYSLTWSCYDPQPAKNRKSEVRSQKSAKASTLQSYRTIYVPCGLCDSCVFRAKGFKEAGIKDPLIKL
ncbi:MAG: 7-cyano-7-deazaguanine synthase QueC [Nitrospirae bacterium RBG_13_39_12]|nr:MAG: 7-cyano-7-deazaguanine synthase QueC [Nitrospirae bacterium RBG_13_39_12]